MTDDTETTEETRLGRKRFAAVLARQLMREIEFAEVDLITPLVDAGLLVRVDEEGETESDGCAAKTASRSGL